MGVYVNSKLSASAQVMEARKKTLRILGAINWNVQYRSGKIIVQLKCA